MTARVGRKTANLALMLQIWSGLCRFWGPAGGVAPNLFRGAHGGEGARDDLRRARAMDVVGRLRFEQLRVREDDPELIVQAMKEETQFWCFVHRSPRQEFVDAQRTGHQA